MGTRRYPELLLASQHETLLIESAISNKVAAARKYLTVDTKAALMRAGFRDYQVRVPALACPVYSLADEGKSTFWQIRPDDPRLDADGKAIKYDQPVGTRMVVDLNPMMRYHLKDPKQCLWITEGIRKADAINSQGEPCLALLGVNNWRGSNEVGGTTAVADWDYVALNGRLVYIVFDSDIMEKPQVHKALVRFKAFLESKKARVKVVYLPQEDLAW